MQIPGLPAGDQTFLESRLCLLIIAGAHGAPAQRLKHRCYTSQIPHFLEYGQGLLIQRRSRGIITCFRSNFRQHIQRIGDLRPASSTQVPRDRQILFSQGAYYCVIALIEGQHGRLAESLSTGNAVLLGSFMCKRGRKPDSPFREIAAHLPEITYGCREPESFLRSIDLDLAQFQRCP